MSSPNPTAAALFHRLHREGLLILPNAWDAGSARLIDRLGARAIATTSAGVAWAHGYPDGGFLPAPLLAATVAEVVRAVRVPVSADVEDGYSKDPAAVADTVAAVIDAGAVGINIEDRAEDPDLLCAKIERAKATGARLGVDLFVNARIDVYLRGFEPADRRLDETISRAERYREAGADGIFVPGVSEPAAIRAIASAVQLPLNVLAWRGLPPAAELEALGVRRLSAGSGLATAAFGRVAALVTEFLRTGASDPLMQNAMPYAEVNALLESSATDR